MYSYYKATTVSRRFYLYSGNLNTWKRRSLYWNGALAPSEAENKSDFLRVWCGCFGWEYLQSIYNRVYCVKIKQCHNVLEQTRYITETEMSSFWWNYHHWLHWKLSKWQLPVQPVMKISSKWRHFRFSDTINLGTVCFALLRCGWVINSLRPGNAYIRHWTGSSLVQVIDWHLTHVISWHGPR